MVISDLFNKYSERVKRGTFDDVEIGDYFAYDYKAWIDYMIYAERVVSEKADATWNDYGLHDFSIKTDLHYNPPPVPGAWDCKILKREIKAIPAIKAF